MWRLRNFAWYLWAPLTVSVAAALLALYLALWAAYDVVPGWHIEWLGSPRLSTTQVVPLLIGALAVTATVSAILAGVGELREVLPPQRLAFTIQLDRPAGTNPIIRVRGWNDGAFVSAFSFGYALHDSDGRLCARVDQGGHGTTLVPGQEFVGNDLQVVNCEHDAVGGKLVISWATDRSKSIRITQLRIGA